VENETSEDLQMVATEAVLTYIEKLPTSHPDYEWGLQFVVSALNSSNKARGILKPAVIEAKTPEKQKAAAHSR
jgi:hypothetical protein